MPLDVKFNDPFWFSIVVPSFNQGAYLADCLSSIISQVGDFGIEILLIDGLSTDNSKQVWEKFFGEINGGSFSNEGYVPGAIAHIPCRFGLRWKIISEKDSGQSEAINKGFRLATAKWGNWLGTDDLLLPNALKVVHQSIIQSKKAKFFYGDVYYQQIGSDQQSRYSPLKPSLLKYLRQRQGLHQTAVFFNLELLKIYGYLDESLHFAMVTELYLRWLINFVPFQQINQVLAVQRVHPQSKTGQCNMSFENFKPEESRVYKIVFKKLNFIHRLVMSAEFSLETIKKYFYSLRYFLATLRNRLLR